MDGDEVDSTRCEAVNGCEGEGGKEENMEHDET
jgi:hypothetical protein